MKNKNIEVFTLWGVYFFSSLVVLVYAFLFVERCLFDGIEEGEVAVLSEGFSPPWYKAYRFSDFEDAEAVINGVNFSVPSDVANKISGKKVDFFYGKYTGVAYEVSDDKNVYWRLFSFFNICIVIFLAIFLVTVIRELELVCLLAFVFSMRMLFQIL
ncbi:hypothetical protein T9A_03251 [Alcanivorax jadensis T9]|uniref:Uncharacterized protein n=1 Tax=Alcanivorax jadensis T9 TaxID=1177181 RepID=A0ABR4W8F6_9GAMM|nr:hypothetical protein [Alcanivorax jadensis]KGD59713.1 hypothetical protein T9A_03251 [Alcanivorax jadensis T9]